MIKKIAVFMFLCVWGTSVYSGPSGTQAGGTLLPVDTIALDEALKQIVRVNGKTDNDLIENAQADLYMYFMENTNSEYLYVLDVVNMCKNIVKDNLSCMNFIKTYNSYIDHANFCLKANTISEDDALDPINTGIGAKDCYRLKQGDVAWTGDYVEGIQKEQYTTESISSLCREFVDAAEKCQIYLIQYYACQLESKELSKKEKKYYQCLLDKAKSGTLYFPIDNMKRECSYI